MFGLDSKVESFNVESEKKLLMSNNAFMLLSNRGSKLQLVGGPHYQVEMMYEPYIEVKKAAVYRIVPVIISFPTVYDLFSTSLLL